MKTNADYTTTYYGPSRFGTPVKVPAGSPVRFLPGPTSRYVLDGNFDACEGLERGTMARHDAEHYGLDIPTSFIGPRYDGGGAVDCWDVQECER